MFGSEGGLLGGAFPWVFGILFIYGLGVWRGQSKMRHKLEKQYLEDQRRAAYRSRYQENRHV